MRLKRIPRPDEGNELWPLPADYLTLTDEGQRQARVNACRQWALPDTPARMGEALAACVSLFDRYYLYPTEDYNPGFYDVQPREPAPYHHDVLRLWGAHQTGANKMTLTIAPRGGAKSMLCRKEMILKLLTHPIYSYVYATGAHHLAERTGDLVRQQLYYNELIEEDWAREPEFGGRIKPRRGDRMSGVLHFYLTNGSELQCISAKSRQRGIRPRRYKLDDPEYDPSGSTSMEALRAFIEVLLFNIVIPAVTRPDTGVDWIGTFLSTRHYAWHAATVLQTPEGPRAIDPRFDHWARLIIPGAEIVDGRLISAWPDMWPATIAEKIERGKIDPSVLSTTSHEELEQIMGRAVYRREILQILEGSDAVFFPFDPLNNEKYGYTITDADDHYTAGRFWQSNALVTWHHNTERRELRLSEFLRTSRVFICLDTSYTSGPDSDFKVATVFALTHENDLFVLDQWSKQCVEPTLVDAALRLADQWHPATIHPEVVTKQVSLFHALEHAVRTRLQTSMGLSYSPAIRALKPGSTAKTAKIAALQPRFEYGLIKLPLHKRLDHPWRRLIDQIQGFNPSHDEDGGLSKDDELDTLSMAQIVLRGRPVAPTPADTAPPADLASCIERGETHDEFGHPLLQSLSVVNRPDLLAKLLRNAQSPKDTNHEPV